MPKVSVIVHRDYGTPELKVEEGATLSDKLEALREQFRLVWPYFIRHGLDAGDERKALKTKYYRHVQTVAKLYALYGGLSTAAAWSHLTEHANSENKSRGPGYSQRFQICWQGLDIEVRYKPFDALDHDLMEFRALTRGEAWPFVCDQKVFHWPSLLFNFPDEMKDIEDYAGWVLDHYAGTEGASRVLVDMTTQNRTNQIGFGF